jgi:hypothetical protein
MNNVENKLNSSRSKYTNTRQRTTQHQHTGGDVEYFTKQTKPASGQFPITYWDTTNTTNTVKTQQIAASDAPPVSKAVYTRRLIKVW